VLERIKTLLNIEDALQDDALDILISNVSDTLAAKLGKAIPQELGFIVEEIAIRRYNRLGSEGFKSETAEGHRIEFYDLDDEFKPYEDIIDRHKEDEHAARKGKVTFL